METVIDRMRQLGATVIDPANIAIGPAYGPQFTALLYEFKHDVAAYLRKYTAAGYPKSLKDLIRFDRSHAGREMRWFGQEIFLQAQQTGSLSDPAYLKARHDATRIARTAVDEALAKHHLDAIIAPTNSPAWTTDLVNGDHFLLGSSAPSAIAGYPNITVPAGYAHGLPVGVSFIAGRWSESKLLALAYSWEQATHVRRPPKFRGSLG
jgi:amidase